MANENETKIQASAGQIGAESPAQNPAGVPGLYDVVCPFCGEGDFDKIGLKLHLRFGWCEQYELIPESDFIPP